MKISIITVCFNSASTIRDTIESVFLQSFNNIEYIVVDGGSKDSTVSILQEYGKRISKVLSESDRGIYDAMNKGITLATGDIIGILNSDDVFENENVLLNIVNLFKGNQSLDVVFGDVVFVESDNLNKIVRYYNSSHFKVWKLRFGWMPPHPATFIKKSAYERVGHYNLDYKISADYELFVRMLMIHRLNFSRVNKVLVRMRTGGVSTSGIKSSLLLNSEIIKLCKRNGVYTNMFFLLLKIPFKLLELLRRP